MRWWWLVVGVSLAACVPSQEACAKTCDGCCKTVRHEGQVIGAVCVRLEDTRENQCGNGGSECSRCPVCEAGVCSYGPGVYDCFSYPPSDCECGSSCDSSCARRCAAGVACVSFRCAASSDAGP